MLCTRVTLRAECARTLKDEACIDEVTSVVNRDVAASRPSFPPELPHSSLLHGLEELAVCQRLRRDLLAESGTRARALEAWRHAEERTCGLGPA